VSGDYLIYEVLYAGSEPEGGCPRRSYLQNCKTAGFFSLNSQLAAIACKCAGISGVTSDFTISG
jgi:hypothetical protein